MWTIKEAAERAGLSPDVLRAWERRYGVVRPTRTASGYRLYSEADIGRLRAMQGLMGQGLKPREAADQLSRYSDPGQGVRDRPGADLLSAAHGAAPPEAGGLPSAKAAGASHGRLVAAAATLDAAALSAFFDELAARGSFEAVCEEILFPGLRALGESWADGTVSVAGEHAASAAALRWLGAQYQAAAQDGRPPQVLVALPPGARHELGALAHAVALRRNGLDVLYLGSDLPVEDMVEAVRATRARVAVLGAVMASDEPAAGRAAAAIRAASKDVRLAFGGPRAGTLAAHGTVLPAGLRQAAAAVRDLVAA